LKEMIKVLPIDCEIDLKGGDNKDEMQIIFEVESKTGLSQLLMTQERLLRRDTTLR